ncbi:hypothetical protein SO694_00077122 [Aureococcus anophagefferens]|uniref:Uncharacterized protein n=1 Tax=Aureococcus anophagefferens TaxID=44056 RepID=A0ABR1FHN1_AURAN
MPAMRLLLLAPLLCGGVRVVERRRLLGTAAAAWPAAAGAAPAWLADVPTESASEALAPPRPREAPRAPAASSRESDRVVARKGRAAAEPGRRGPSTATLRLSVRVARADGTFSVRDDDPDPPVFGDLDLGLYGDAGAGSGRPRTPVRGGRAIGDGRAREPVFPGKILRRVEVTRVQLL